MLRHVDFKKVLEKKAKPNFKPPEDHLNCDPCLELEEMIVETRPLHKKKKRLAKQRSAQRDSDPETALIKEFIVYNRYKELKRKAMEKKENDWQRELEHAMANSIVNSLAPIHEKPLTIAMATTAIKTASTTTVKNVIREASKLPTTVTSMSKNTTTTSMASDTPTCSKCQHAAKVSAKEPSENIEFIDRTPSPKETTSQVIDQKVL